jgi:DHA1 family tetracycline resistance protein-like MFS transporter
MLDMLALGIMAPVLPKLVVQFEGGDVASAASINGVFSFAWATMQFVFSPVQGSFSDHFGRRPMLLLLSTLGLGLDYLVMALAPSVGWLSLGRVLSGITAASFSTAGAYIADVTAGQARGEVRAARRGVRPRRHRRPGGGRAARRGRPAIAVLGGGVAEPRQHGARLLHVPESLPPDRRDCSSWRAFRLSRSGASPGRRCRRSSAVASGQPSKVESRVRSPACVGSRG